jgi:hypothetical protein
LTPQLQKVNREVARVAATAPPHVVQTLRQKKVAILRDCLLESHKFDVARIARDLPEDSMDVRI